MFTGITFPKRNQPLDSPRRGLSGNLSRLATYRFLSLVRIRLVILAAVLVIGCAVKSTAADLFWTNVLGGNFTNKTLWMTGRSPTNSDNANFTNNAARQISWTTSATNASALFNATAAVTYTQAIGSSTWYVTNQYILGQNAGTTGIVTQISGTLIVTNNVGTGTMIIGRAGDGTFNFNGGTIIADHLYVTNINHSDFNFNSGSLTLQGDSIISNTSTSFSIGTTAGGATADLFVNSGANVVINKDVFLGNNSTSTVTVSDSGTILNVDAFKIGQINDANLVVVSNSATLITSNADVGANSDFNKVIITGSGTLWTNTAALGMDSLNNTLIVSNGASVFVGGGFSMVSNNNSLFIYDSTFTAKKSTSLLMYDGSNNTIVVSGSNALLDHSANTFFIGYGFSSGLKTINNSLIITNGGKVFDTTGFIGDSGLATNNLVLVSDSGSVWSNSVNLYMGSTVGAGATSAGLNDNTLIISNGGAVYNDNGYIGDHFSGTNEMVIVTGLGSLWRNSQTLSVGTNANTAGSGLILVLDRGTLEANAITNGFNGSGNITNNGGIFQFTTADPTIVTNPGGAIVITNGTISYRNIANAPIIYTNDLMKVKFFGSNTFMLNNSTNAILSSYTFTNGLGATNYAHLTLENGRTMWQATNTLIGGGSQFLITNTLATTFGTITNSGTIVVSGPATTVTNLGVVVLNANGAGGAGSLVNLTGTNSFIGAVRLGATSSISILDDQLTMDGTLTNNSLNITITNGGSSTLVLNSDIQGSGGVTHNGTGTLILGGNNASFSGVITNNVGGTIVSASSTGLGTGNVVMNGGFLTFTNANQDYDQTFVFNNAVTQTVASGVHVVMGRNANDITGSGLIVKQGAGELLITNHVTQDASGGWRIDEGTVTMEVKGGLGTGTITMNGGELRQYVSSFTLDNPISITADSTFSVTNGSDFTLSSTNITGVAGTTWTINEVSPVAHSGSIIFTGSNINFAGNIDLSDTGLRLINAAAGAPSSTAATGVPATNQFTGIISGLGDTTQTIGAFEVISNITVVLTRTNTYTGTTRIQEGTLIVESEGAMGSNTRATAITNNGTLAFLSNFTYSSAKSIYLSSTGGVRGVGLVGVGGTNRFAGYITNTTDSSIGTWAGNLTLSGGMLVTNSLVITNAANSVLTNSGIIVGTGPITHNGSGTVVFTGLNTFSGAVTNNGGTFEINSPTGLGVTTSVVLNGGTLLFKGSLTNTSAAVALNGGIISESDTNVSLGAMTISANSTVSLGSGGAAGRLTFASGTNTVGSGAKLTIYGWSWNSGLSGGSDDLIFFTSTSFETASFLNNVTFFGTGGGARVLSSGELVPITPEPCTVWGGAMVLAVCLKRFRKRGN